jgi:hypothetical protein
LAQSQELLPELGHKDRYSQIEKGANQTSFTKEGIQKLLNSRAMLKSQSQADSMIMKEGEKERKERIKQNNILMKSIYQGSLFKDPIKADVGWIKKA